MLLIEFQLPEQLSYRLNLRDKQFQKSCRQGWNFSPFADTSSRESNQVLSLKLSIKKGSCQFAAKLHRERVHSKLQNDR